MTPFFVNVLTAMACAGMAPIRPLTPPAALPGVWGVEASLGPRVRGTLIVDGRVSPWHARIAGYDVVVARDGARIRFALPRGEGEFRGGVDSASLYGFWVQPAGVVNSTRYATPVRFTRAGARVWHGGVAPLSDTVRFYVSIQPKPDGTLSAFISDPEFNVFRRRTYDVIVSGDTVELRNTKRPDDRITGVWNRATNQLLLPLLDPQQPLAFTRRGPHGASGFFPRTTPDTKYHYVAPGARDDGWSTASLADVGIELRPIAGLVEAILAADPADNSLDIHSLLIARHGKLVFEEYFYGFTRQTPHDMRSASKTFAAALAGMARDHGAPIGPETLVYAQFADEQLDAHPDARKSRMTVGELMTMTSGLACDDNSDSSPGNENTMQSQSAQPDWYKYTLDLPMAADPGGHHAVYCSAGVNLVGGLVARAAHAWLPELFDAYIARPLAFGPYHINLMPTGEAYMGGGLRLRPRDELKLGQLYLDGGVWRGRRVVSADWVAQSIATHTEFDSQTDYDAPHEYGFGWHINHLRSAGRTFRVYSMGGNGGQIVMVIPELDLVVAFNGGSYGEFTKWYRWGLQLVPRYIVPAALNPSGSSSGSQHLRPR